MNMNLKVGDKVTIRKNLSESEYNVVDDMKKYRGKVATITDVINGSHYLIDLDKGAWCWNDFMFEEDKSEEEKFRAFLNEIARGDKSAEHKDYYKMYAKLNDIVNAPYGDYSNPNEIDTLIDELVAFYSNFKPKPKAKNF
jgi:hypothetical protein